MNEGLAVRWFKNLCEKSEIASDLALYYLGEYDLESGAISSAPEFVMNGVLEVAKYGTRTFFAERAYPALSACTL